MKISELKPPRIFTVGQRGSIQIRHSANLQLDENDQVTFISASGSEYDVVRKSWGYYASPSMNGRLSAHGLRAVLVRNLAGKAFLLLVEAGQEQAFQEYLTTGRQEIICWLDSDTAVQQLCAQLLLPVGKLDSHGENV